MNEMKMLKKCSHNFLTLFMRACFICDGKIVKCLHRFFRKKTFADCQQDCFNSNEENDRSKDN